MGALDVSAETSPRRALNHRDGGCRFPGCTVKRCDAHHVEHWAAGGETNLDNLMLLCRFHHRALHEGGFRVVLDADGSCRQGLEIDRMSGLPGWYGESLDLNRALEALRPGLDTQN